MRRTFTPCPHDPCTSARPASAGPPGRDTRRLLGEWYVAGREGGAIEVPRRRLFEKLVQKLEHTVEAVEKAGIAEWVELFRKPRRLLYLNFLAGVARGLGVAVGFSLMGAVLVILLGRLARLNLPVIGEFVADVARIVQLELKSAP